jgi:hypothetical protein
LLYIIKSVKMYMLKNKRGEFFDYY